MTARRERDWEDAFFEDEFSEETNKNGAHKNRFDTAPSGSVYLSVKMRNLLDASWERDKGATPVPQPEHIPPEWERHRSNYYIFVPSMVARKVAEARRDQRPRPRINVTILWGVGGEINVHGLRAVFEDSESTILINVAGRERPAWGIGFGKYKSTHAQLLGEDDPGTDQLRTLMKKAGVEYADPKIRVLAAYSTGYHGMIQSINNDLLPLDDLSRIVFFDCLYRGDRPRLPRGEIPPSPHPDEWNSGGDESDLLSLQDGGKRKLAQALIEARKRNHQDSPFNTRRALNKVLGKVSATQTGVGAEPNRRRVDVIAYSVTAPGSPLYLLPAKHTDPVQHTVALPRVVDLRKIPPYIDKVLASRRVASTQLERALTALIMTRYLRTGVKDGFFTENQVPEGFRDLLSRIPPRGRVASSEQRAKARPGPGVISLAAWHRDNAGRIAAAMEHLEAAQKLVDNHELILPVPGDSKGEELHRGFVPEFAWEVLL
ncbi:hypothetical protein [Streptomyces sp. KS 21]|uniref:hypothetical protein n=1 Tax=Streptomyces sp. KS 21 TaxID=2485150 RepID=UPI0010631528|nr:hypothetical protein [Streptomyces sp. KS 21]TDU80692.1 hypothetical protein EDD91_7610 [Streptomyces sp. KS 21]